MAASSQKVWHLYRFPGRQRQRPFLPRVSSGLSSEKVQLAPPNPRRGAAAGRTPIWASWCARACCGDTHSDSSPGCSWDWTEQRPRGWGGKRQAKKTLVCGDQKTGEFSHRTLWWWGFFYLCNLAILLYNLIVNRLKNKNKKKNRTESEKSQTGRKGHDGLSSNNTGE